MVGQVWTKIRGCPTLRPAVGVRAIVTVAEPSGSHLLQLGKAHDVCPHVNAT